MGTLRYREHGIYQAAHGIERTMPILPRAYLPLHLDPGDSLCLNEDPVI